MPSMVTLEEHMQLWNQAQVQLIDVRLCTAEVALGFSMPSSGFIYAADNIQQIEFSDACYPEPTDMVLHGGQGTPVQIVPRLGRGGQFYLVTYRAEWRQDDAEWSQLAERTQFGERVSMVHANSGNRRNNGGSCNVEERHDVEERRNVEERRDIGSTASLRTLLHTMASAWQQQPGGQLQAKAHFLSFIYEWVQLQHQPIQAAISSPIAQVIQYMQHFYAQPLTLKQLAERANYSVPHLCALFKEATGYTPIDYLARLRVEAAKSLLADSALSLPEVAEQTGYRDPSYFGRIFKRIVGLSPQQFKRSAQDKRGLAAGRPTGVTAYNSLMIKRPMLRIVEHELGEAEIGAVPQRIVALDWTMAEYLLALGVTPLGVSELEGMHRWVGLPIAIPGNIMDAGPRVQLDLERIAELSPDLIIGTRVLAGPYYDALRQIAPTVTYDLFPPARHSWHRSEYDTLEHSFRHLAAILERETLASGIQCRLNDSYTAMREYLRSTNNTTSQAMIAFGYSMQDNSLLRLSNDGSLAVGVLERLGLANAYKPGHYEPAGFTTVGIDEIEVSDNAHMLYVVQRDDKIALSRLQQERAWKMLNVTSHRRSRTTPAGMIWPYGGPLSVSRLAVAATRSLAMQSSRDR